MNYNEYWKYNGFMSDKRTHFSQLPSVKETEEILKKEAKREMPVGKANLHYANFLSVIKWMEDVGLDAHIFKDKCSWQEVIATGEELKSELVLKTLEKQHNPIEVAKYLSENDIPQKSDLIMLFGSNSKKRVDKTWELWAKGLSNKIIITGGKPNYIEENRKSEAEIFEEDLINLGVPKEKIIVEDKSITIPDNVRSSFNLLDKLGEKHESVIIVLAWFALRRAWVHLMKYGEENIKICRTETEIVDPNLLKDNWHRNELGIKTIFDQFVKMKVAQEMNTA